jgi:DNA-binding transcriptional ArsR family regulator
MLDRVVIPAYISSFHEVTDRGMSPALAIAKALADETRLRSVMALRGGELCLCQLVELFGLAPSTISRHLNILHEAGLLQRRKAGRWVFYRLAERAAPSHVKQALRWAQASMETHEQVARDEVTLRRIRNEDLEELCRCYEKS